MHRNHRTSRHLVLASSIGLSLALTVGCATTDDASSVESTTTASAPTERQAITPRLTVSYDGGVLVLDAASLAVVGDIPAGGFTRLRPAGDGRHVMVADGDAFRVLDAGTWTAAHGDHSHHYTVTPSMSEIDFAAEEPGHVVTHAGKTALFNDGTGRVEIFDPARLSTRLPAVENHTTPQPHHGVAVPLTGGGLLTTIGNAESRSGVVVLDQQRAEILRNEQCPGVHGEALAAADAVVLGCQDGLLVYKDGSLSKVQSPDPYGRIGNQAGSSQSSVVLGDYKSDPNAELERPQRISLTDTATSTMTLVDLGTSYTFRSLGRGPAGEALVLGTDGAIHVVDAATGALTKKIAVIDPWTEPTRWQEPRPALHVDGATAFVTDPASREIIAVSLDTGAVSARAALDHVPNELTGVTG